MARLESVKNYINAEIEERGFIDNQIKIDFADICEANEEIGRASCRERV